ncbi:hypothetical protein [Magnetococcus marinus]|uniref:hypothetical protein n=1 Tax=Magnetococcus marinus TaxID=1124597 RepID=UPI00117F3602|nr:hypothetical protein [Magnetococcus marinus]
MHARDEHPSKHANEAERVKKAHETESRLRRQEQALVNKQLRFDQDLQRLQQITDRVIKLEQNLQVALKEATDKALSAEHSQSHDVALTARQMKALAERAQEIRNREASLMATEVRLAHQIDYLAEKEAKLTQYELHQINLQTQFAERFAALRTREKATERLEIRIHAEQQIRENAFQKHKETADLLDAQLNKRVEELKTRALDAQNSEQKLATHQQLLDKQQEQVETRSLEQKRDAEHLAAYENRLREKEESLNSLKHQLDNAITILNAAQQRGHTQPKQSGKWWTITLLGIAVPVVMVGYYALKQTSPPSLPRQATQSFPAFLEERTFQESTKNAAVLPELPASKREPQSAANREPIEVYTPNQTTTKSQQGEQTSPSAGYDGTEQGQKIPPIAAHDGSLSMTAALSASTIAGKASQLKTPSTKENQPATLENSTGAAVAIGMGVDVEKPRVVETTQNMRETPLSPQGVAHNNRVVQADALSAQDQAAQALSPVPMGTTALTLPKSPQAAPANQMMAIQPTPQRDPLTLSTEAATRTPPKAEQAEPIPALSATEITEKESQVKRLLELAMLDIPRNRLSWPEDNNALIKIRKALVIIPGYPDALRSLEAVTDRYIFLVAQHMREGQLNKATLFLNKAKSLHPKRETVLRAEGPLFDALAGQTTPRVKAFLDNPVANP